MSTSQIHTTNEYKNLHNLGVFVRQWGRFGTGPGAFQYPFGIAINSLTASAFVVDTGNNRIQVFGL